MAAARLCGLERGGAHAPALDADRRQDPPGFDPLAQSQLARAVLSDGARARRQRRCRPATRSSSSSSTSSATALSPGRAPEATAHCRSSRARWRISTPRFSGSRAGLGVDVTPSDGPVKSPTPSRSPSDRVHSAYDPDAAHAFWRILISADRVLKLFRTGFIGKASPVHFFWGSFDLAVTRFSGRRAPLHPGGVPGLSDRVVREAYSHEVSSAGFWPGGAGLSARDLLLLRLSGAARIPKLPGSADPLISKRVSANSCCPTPPFMRATIRTRWSFDSSRKPMRPRPIAGHGIGAARLPARRSGKAAPDRLSRPTPWRGSVRKDVAGRLSAGRKGAEARVEHFYAWRRRRLNPLQFGWGGNLPLTQAMAKA